MIELKHVSKRFDDKTYVLKEGTVYKDYHLHIEVVCENLQLISVNSWD